ncbi:MAG: LysR family transcriptional regulator [Rhodobacteraceae bacterium PARR1]|nr:MAG: LysR family transcriptional regulator [Rhodobacteraceae bacterium PARR1]
MIASLRHLRLVLEVQRTRSVTRAAAAFNLSQPAVTTALTGLEARLGVALFDRHPSGVTPTPVGAALCLRIARAFAVLDPALSELSARLVLTASHAKIRAVIAVAETESFSAAARLLGIAQPTVHRAVAEMEGEAGQALFSRTAHGVIPTRPVRHLAIAAQLAFSEFEQARVDIAEVLGREAGRVVIGAMPLARSVLLGPAIARFRASGRNIPVRVVEGPYSELSLGLRRGEIDFLVGALRPDVDDLQQEPLLTDELTIVCRPDHPAFGQDADMRRLAHWPWIVAPEGTPARDHFHRLFAGAKDIPVRLVETGSMELMVNLVSQTDHLGFVSARQVQGVVQKGFLAQLASLLPGTSRAIGLTFRSSWHPTRAQSDMVAAIRCVAAQAETA